MITCPYDGCDKEVTSERGLTFHINGVHDNEAEYADKSVLQKMYVENGMSSREIASKLDTTKATILSWLDRHDIEKRRSSREKPPVPRVNNYGHEVIRNTHNGNTVAVAHHRLIAVAHHDIDSVKNKHVHHENSIPWDNRPENLEIMDSSKHIRYHHEKGDYGHRQRNDDGQYIETDAYEVGSV